MTTPSILWITIKDDESTLRSKYLIYEIYSVSPHDPLIQKHIAESLGAFGKEPTDIQIKIQMHLV
jgi:hypothetical protein